MSSIREIMKTDVISIEAHASPREATEKMVKHRVSGLPVVSASGKLVGVITEKDVLRLFYDDVATVSELMTEDPVSVAVDDDLVEVFDILMSKSFRRVFVHEGGRLRGLISRADLMPVVLDALNERI